MLRPTQDIASDRPVSEWRGTISLFEGMTSVYPFFSGDEQTWLNFADAVAPKQPQIICDKSQGTFFLPTVLREAPLVGATRERAQVSGKPLNGVMRSAAHVVAGTAIKLDLDGVTKHKLVQVLECLKRQRLAYILFSTHSHRLKPGIRARLILPLDQALASAGYAQAVRRASTELLGCSLDASEAHLHQLAGCFAAHPDRSAGAFRHAHLDGVCLSSQALLASSTPVPVTLPTPAASLQARLLLKTERDRVARALTWLNANDFQTWCMAGMMLKGAGLGDYGLSMWLAFSDRASGAAKQRNNEPRYDPETMWGSFSPCVPGHVAVATLLARARDAAAVVARAVLETDSIGGPGDEALTYLARNHPQFFDSLVAECHCKSTKRTCQ